MASFIPHAAVDSSMSDTAVDALLKTIEGDDEVAFDELSVARSGGGYAFSTPETEETGLTADDLRGVARGDAHVDNWYFWHAVAPRNDAEWAFLRWLEDADRPVTARYEALGDGCQRTWGQLHLNVRREEDQRRYEIRHLDDADRDREALTSHDDPAQAREIAKFDDRDRYRPLKTAPTLRHGWVFDGLAAEAFVTAVDYFYPATVANWHRERESDLDVTHWTDHTERQSGIFGLVKTWNRGEGYEHVNRVAEACCVDSQCVKRREWDYDGDADLDVSRGDGAFPCREPCSVVLTAARQWTKLDGERSRTYEFELTPSEKEQLEAIVDAVADGEVEDIREADVYEGANRYRARYLRAKLFDDEGNLCGVPTDEDD
jgi:hypothetical protein